MTKKDDEPTQGSVWSGLARMEAELQDPDEDETFVYKSKEMAELRRAALAGRAAPAEILPTHDDEVEGEPTSRQQIKMVPSSGRQLKPEADAPADVPDDHRPSLDAAGTEDDDDTDMGYAELLRARKERDERPRRDDAQPEPAPESDATVALWVEAPDGADKPAPRKASGNTTTILWVLVILLTIVALAVAFAQGRLG